MGILGQTPRQADIATEERRFIMKKKGIAITVSVAAALAAVLAGVYVYGSGHLRVSVNGFDMTGQSAAQIAERFADDFNAVSVELDEDGKAQLTGTMPDYGYSVDQNDIESQVSKQLSAQTGSFVKNVQAIAKGVTINVSLSKEFDENTFDSFVTGSSFSTERVAATPGSVQFDDSTGKFTVTEATAGNTIDDEKLQKYVQKQIDSAIEGGNLEDSMKIDLPDSVYTDADVTSDNEELKKEADAYNAYAGSSVTYTFGSATETVNVDTFQSWLTYDDSTGTVSLDDSQLDAYVVGLASKYDTQYKARTFTSSRTGQPVTIEASRNEYGYTIDQSSEEAQLKSDILSGTAVTREPVYISQNDYGNPYYLGRNGTDDLNGTYVEVDITAQHVWFYKNGSLVIDRDCVTGNESAGHGTTTGAFPLAFKKSPSTLTGSQNGYQVDVQYWMPFYEGEGLHDAWWRSSFGGTIYQTNGSHGCVNLPSSVAQTIYDNIDVGTAILIYKES